MFSADGEQLEIVLDRYIDGANPSPLAMFRDFDMSAVNIHQTTLSPGYFRVIITVQGQDYSVQLFNISLTTGACSSIALPGIDETFW